LLEERIEPCSFERLRGKLFQYCPEIKANMLPDFDYSKFALDHEDPVFSTYAFVGRNSRRRKTENGFSGGFYVSTKLVSQADFRCFLENSSYELPEDVMSWLEETQPPESPMVHTTWDDAAAYCSWLSQVAGEFYTLPY
jgi:formylglycine-generating enzyme required for sulfatase activity